VCCLPCLGLLAVGTLHRERVRHRLQRVHDRIGQARTVGSCARCELAPPLPPARGAPDVISPPSTGRRTGEALVSRLTRAAAWGE
jgi:hypothetical protein